MQLQEFLGKIEKENQKKLDSIMEQSHAENERAFSLQKERIEAEEKRRKIEIEKTFAGAHQKETEIIKQEFHKRELLFRQGEIQGVLSGLKERFFNCSQEEFNLFLKNGLDNLEANDFAELIFGDEVPVEKWQGWAKDYSDQRADIELRFSEEKIRRRCGFVLRQKKMEYRLLMQEIEQEFLREYSAKINGMLFGEKEQGNERP